MAFVTPPRVLETGNGSGTGNITLLGASGSGEYDAFNEHLSVSDTTTYVIVDGSQFEIGYGTYSSATPSNGTMTRDTVIRSSSGTSKISLSGSNFNIFHDIPPEISLLVGPTGAVTNVSAVAASVLPKDLASLKALPEPADNTIIYLGYGATETDGLGGFFRWDDTSTATADDINIVELDAIGASAGRFIRERPFLFPGEIASDSIPADSIARRSDTHNLISKRTDTGVKFIPEVQTVARSASYATLAALKAVASSNWKQGDLVELRGLAAEGDIVTRVIGTWQAASTNTDSLDVTFVRPDDISGSNPGRFQFPFDIYSPALPLPNARAASTLTIASGAVTVTRAAHVIAAESGTADDLDTITTTGFPVGSIITIRPDSGDTITVTNGVGNITTDTGSSIVLADVTDYCTIYVTASGVVASSGLASYNNGLTAAVERSITTRLAERISILDFIPETHHAGILARTIATTTDLSTYYQAWATAIAGKTGYAPAGKYPVRTTINLSSNTALVLDERATFICDGANWVGIGGGTGNRKGRIFQNINHTASSLTDTDITIIGGEFDSNDLDLTLENGGQHLLYFRYVNRVHIESAKGDGQGTGENLTALLACRDTFVGWCYAQDFINCAIDHWDGAGQATAVFNTVRCSGTDNAQGMQFTGTGSALEDRASADVFFAFNRIYGVRDTGLSASAILINANDAGSSVVRAKTMSNYIEDCDIGIAFTGVGGQHTSVSDTMKSVTMLPMFLQAENADAGRDPNNCRVIDLHLIDCDHDAGNVAMISVSGDAHEIQARVTNTDGTPDYSTVIWFTSNATNCRAELSVPSASSLVTDNGTNCYVEYFDRSTGKHHLDGVVAASIQIGEEVTAGLPTNAGNLILSDIASTYGEDGGLEVRLSGFSNGYGAKIRAYDAGGGTLRYSIGFRVDSATFTEAFRFQTDYSLDLLNASGVYKVNGTQVVGARVINADIADPNAITAYSAPDISASYVEAEVQAIADALATLRGEVADVREKLVAANTIIRTHGLGAAS